MRILLFCLAFMATPVWSDPEVYRLDMDQSDVGFSYTFEGSEKSGTMPVQSAVMRIDLDNVPASEVSVTLNPSKARAGFIFATQVMKGPEVLNTRAYPTIQFRSTSVRGDLSGATVTGDLTVRGVTRSVTLQAGLFRQRGTEVGDRDNLTILLTGAIDRNDFGAGGFGSYVGPTIGLRIVARISR